MLKRNPFALNLGKITRASIRNFPTYYVHLTARPGVYLVNQTPNASVYSMATRTPANAAIKYHREKTHNEHGRIQSECKPTGLNAYEVIIT